MNSIALLQNWIRQVAGVLVIAMVPSCVSPQDQFGHAVMTGNVAAARQHVAPRYARMKITESNGQQSVPIQYAIVQNNKEMASFLLQNDCHKDIGGQNLTYYCARNGYSQMARYFASVGEGSFSDIDRAQRDRVRSNQQAAMGGLIALTVLAAMMSGSGGSGGSCPQCKGVGTVSYTIQGAQCSCPTCGGDGVP